MFDESVLTPVIFDRVQLQCFTKSVRYYSYTGHFFVRWRRINILNWGLTPPPPLNLVISNAVMKMTLTGEIVDCWRHQNGDDDDQRRHHGFHGDVTTTSYTSDDATSDRGRYHTTTTFIIHSWFIPGYCGWRWWWLMRTTLLIPGPYQQYSRRIGY